MRSDGRAVSEVVGFVLVFTLVIGTVTIVYAGGFGGLDATRDAERVNNAERAFDVMANNFEQLASGDAPNRATEIKLSEASLSTTSNRLTTINASGIDTAAGANPVAIRYDSGDGSQIVYELGAVIRIDDGNAVMIREPDFLFADNRTVVRYISARGSGQGTGGSTTVLVRAEKQSTALLATQSPAANVTIRMQTHPERAAVWEAYFEREIEDTTGTSNDYCDTTSVDVTTDRVVCYGFTVDSLSVSRVRVDVELT
ncbi:hypothetical protein KY092_06320 [Natronomonas gomsonensis]|uniref:DUF7289 family protein n=1 Tax=Natronomonas gomsonensis TaxID=1046043 RepID=UPI0020CA768E|nr:hypothetical protein [Natronomonas gomsonensis]MCY4730168.1 hypothetical protein [Natronomonas gomsonensis]